MKEYKNNQLRKEDVNKVVTLYGFVANKRKMKDLTFIDLRDFYGITQVIIKDQNFQINKESVIKITGKVVLRKNINPHLLTGDIEIIASEWEILSKSKNELPFIIRDDLNINEDLRLEYRFLDLRRDKMKQNIILRHKLFKLIRDFLAKEEFLEIETPMLSRSTPEGARDFLVQTRKENHFFALPQSPQLYKQTLISAGFEKYFQIVKCFRDEDSRKDRQPEFTQLDIEMAYIDEKSIKALIEKLFLFLFKKLNLDFDQKFREIDYQEAIDKYGTDKPDIRYKCYLNEITKHFQNSDYEIYKNVSSVKYIIIDEKFSNKEINHFKEVVFKNGGKNFNWGFYDQKNNIKKGNAFKNFETITMNLIKDQNSIFFVGGDRENVTKALGALRVEIADLKKLANPQEFKFLWVENFPLYEKEKKDNEIKIKPFHHPFTNCSESIELNKEDELSIPKSKAYDLVLNGYEIGGGSIRNHNWKKQEKIFETLGFSKKQINQQFNFFKKIFDYGLPPHGGIAFGLDRILMILSNTDSIRDVIPFPKNAKGFALFEKTPSNHLKNFNKDNLENSNVFFEKGNFEFHSKRYEEAIKYYNKAIEINPQFFQCYCNKGLALDKLEKYQEAIECYDKAIKINPQSFHAYNSKGISLLNLKRNEEAIKCYDEAIKIDPNNYNSYNNKGISLNDLGKYEEAIECYDKAIEIDPNRYHSYINKGISLNDLGKYEEAIECYDKAIKLNPNDYKTYYNKGLALDKLEKYQDAIECYEQAIKLNPNDYQAYYNKGLALEKLEKYQDAIECYEQAIKLNPNNLEIISRINNLK